MVPRPGVAFAFIPALVGSLVRITLLSTNQIAPCEMGVTGVTDEPVD